MVDEKLKNKNVLVCNLKSEALCNASIKECLDNLFYENINALYERYDCLESEPMYKSILVRKNYLYTNHKLYLIIVICTSNTMFSCGRIYAFLLPYVFLQENMLVLILKFVNKGYAI